MPKQIVVNRPLGYECMLYSNCLKPMHRNAYIKMMILWMTPPPYMGLIKPEDMRGNGNGSSWRG
jgi:hypothetical protein